MATKTIVIDKGSSLEVKVHDRSFGGGMQTLLRLNESNLDLVTLGDLLVRGVPIQAVGSGPSNPYLALDSERAYAVSGNDECVLTEWNHNLDNLGQVLRCKFSALVRNPGRYCVRIGGTPGQCDGRVAVALTVTDAGGYPNVLSEATGAEFLNPRDFQVIKLTGSSDVTSQLRSASIFLESV